ncbi:MAG: glycine cleavage system protein H [Candidatus Raymondbacteria bacterium RifOxyC12_full_50_8]|uniref:Glycine cleavage system H protein n=1 Tax=Candidatus Raymondbacteria bacterium RIFOXYD12_FULL_49_13 TaxID=1817890 RepID=A0A1F7F098_UNCRA|nr:MAG: glycine cleavage system protein H [Candidatus Raymondbacteria bacterium RIFOXYA2_FULL_49_16]OGK00074.1 MAG: glycine cleavage system protein H [Candidatus Raymondbacteria bacterium RIFOXYD12_FULL_49_13]OGK01363.1 MAG: glycine cleavage system protein H [Candidatus Raymondbacteria bacterium RifOxyC12_full_50_8]OGK03691.1 MAG: glycine cleavage system protein H [Candidatus Raymondbacteria bacterium RifOxyB12_full_50_8]OGP45063.1 MAG: glycine cleavage system protein H [Candidatus Raymondbacte
MASVPGDLLYTKDHEWAQVKGAMVTSGITDHAQHELGDIVFVQLPSVGVRVVQGQPYGEIEAVKTVAPLNAPVGGTVKEVNTALAENAGTINTDPYGQGWIIRIEMDKVSETAALLNAAAYAKLI